MNNYLEKGFFIIEGNSNQLGIIPNDVKLTIHVIDQLEFFLIKDTAIYSVANTINKFHIQSDLHLIYKKTFIMINKRK